MQKVLPFVNNDGIHLMLLYNKVVVIYLNLIKQQRND